MKTKAERHEWLKERIGKTPGGVDILDAVFVDDFVAFSGAAMVPKCFGAHGCPTLGRDLHEMWRNKVLTRGILGLSGGAWMPGFPKWVYSYDLILGATDSEIPE